MSNTVIQPYLFFGGRCEEALEFYKTAIGAQIEMVMHFNESPEPPPPGMLPPGFETKVMHAAMENHSLTRGNHRCHYPCTTKQRQIKTKQTFIG